MDGLKARLNDSLQLRLSLWLSLVILGIALVAGVFSFVVAFNEANELQDDLLRQTAALFDRHHLPVRRAGDRGRLSDNDPEARIMVQMLSGADARTNQSGGDAAFPVTLPDGIQTRKLGGETYRVVVNTLGSGERIAVAQATEVRDEIARDSALRALLPFLVLIPILLLVVADLVRKMFRPIAAAATDVDQRGEQELHPIVEQDLPTEIRPFVVAINRLLARIAKSMAMQRRFVASAAHELRSPLTALSLQAERLASAEMSATAHARLATLRQGIERNRTLLNQLLTLARAQSSTVPAPTTVSIQHVFRRVLEDLVPLADARDIDIGMASEGDALVLADEASLFMLIKNLVDNAIRYTPAGGRVDLVLDTGPGTVALEVEDTGPGIPKRTRERVFEPFYRVLGGDESGSGLGLSIVKTVVERLGGTISLTTAIRSSHGLRAVVALPRAEAPGVHRAGS